MKSLSDFRDEQALDLLADVFEPVVKIMSDNEFLTAFDKGKRLEAVKIAIKNHKPEVMEVLAAMEGVPVSEYHCNVFTVPIRLGEVVGAIMKEPELMAFFTPQGKTKSKEYTKTSSGSATGITKETEEV